MALSTIRWQSYNESEIQEIIVRCLKTAGYVLHNIHKSDPAGEKGVDILAIMDGRKTAIAVKMKPKGTDRAQLQDLCEYSADKRIYIYIKTPTHTFIEYMQRSDIKSSVEFWSGESIGDELFELDPNFLSHLALSYSPACFECNSIVNILADIWTDAKDISSEDHISIAESIKSEFKPGFELWELKDHSSALHRIAMSLELLFGKMTTIAFDKSQQLAILKSSQKMLEKVRDEIIHRFHWNLKEVLENWDTKILRIASATRLRTNWLYIFNFRRITTAFFPNKLIETFSELQESDDKWEELLSGQKNEMDSILRVDEFKKTQEVHSAGLGGINWFFGALKQFAWGVEEIVNDLYKSLSDGDFDRYHSDWGKYPSEYNGTESIAGLPGLNNHDLLRPYMLDSVFERDDVARSYKELLKIRFLISNDQKKVECPKCHNKLDFASSGRSIILSCIDETCDYQFE